MQSNGQWQTVVVPLLAVKGPLSQIKIVEFAGIGPAPFAAMMLSDLGAEIVRIDRAATVSSGADKSEPAPDVLNRGRRSVGIDLKSPGGVETAKRLIARADVLLEGFRPGVMEKLGLGPEACLTVNPRLVYGRMTGWGQDGPWAKLAGHDINYIALAGVLDQIGRAGEKPIAPLNLVGDFGGGGMLLALGVVSAIVERATSGKGQVVDAAMIDGAALLTTMFYAFRNMGLWSEERGTNVLDSGAHFYEVYATKDGKYVAVGAIEPQFYAELLTRLGLAGDARFQGQLDRDAWPELKRAFEAVFKEKTRDEWAKIFEGSDACVAPVLSALEAPEHPHHVARKTFTTVAGALQPSPAPRFSRTPLAIARPPAAPGAHTDEALRDWGFTDAELAALRASRSIA
ncbi:MAG: CaiB/BaiF CoA-transferase family protein [Polyangiaceae bacterium]